MPDDGPSHPSDLLARLADAADRLDDARQRLHGLRMLRARCPDHADEIARLEVRIHRLHEDVRHLRQTYMNDRHGHRP